MREITIQEIQELCKEAVGKINTIYAHWSGMHYGQYFSDYHFNIGKDGTIYTDIDSLLEKKSHTYYRNSDSIGIALACAYKANGANNLGMEPPTGEQIEAMAQLIAVLCVDLGLPCDIQHVMTHAEAADNMDGRNIYYPEYTGFPNNTYGPNSNVDRWDLWVLHEGDEPGSGGDIIRGKAMYYASTWGCTI